MGKTKSRDTRCQCDVKPCTDNVNSNVAKTKNQIAYTSQCDQEKAKDKLWKTNHHGEMSQVSLWQQNGLAKCKRGHPFRGQKTVRSKVPMHATNQETYKIKYSSAIRSVKMANCSVHSDLTCVHERIGNS